MGSKVVLAAFATSGVVHLAAPQVFDPLIPRQLGPPRPWVLGSGLVELVSAYGLARRRPWAPQLAAATLAVIWVGNLSMAVDWQRSHRRSKTQKAIAWVRLPLQIPLIYWAWTSPPRAADGSGAPSERRLGT